MAPQGTAPQRVVVATRPRRYPARPRVNLVHRDGKIRVTDDPGGRGPEIAREILACPACARATRNAE